MYKYIGTEENPTFNHLTQESLPPDFPKDVKNDIKMRRIFKVCNPPTEITKGSEGLPEGNHTLEGVIIFLRHGDRGPMSHVRNITSVRCDQDLMQEDSLSVNPLYSAFKMFMKNLSMPGNRPVGAEKFLGSFNDFQLSPPLSKKCQLGQLTPIGLSQILKIGNILKEVYGNRLGIGNSTLSRNNAKLYTTRYRRTVQSAIAFLTAFLSPEDLLKMNLQESYSVSFCFNDCACPAVDKYSHNFAKERTEHFHSHPAVMELVKKAAPIVYDNDIDGTPLFNDPHSLRDAFLTYVCHGAELPCIEAEDEKKYCVHMDQVTGLFAYTEWEAKQYAKSVALKRSSLLRAYGVLKNVVSHMLSIISEKKTKLVLYSGHDMTLQYITTALGLLSETTATAYYASRLILEVYRGSVFDNESHPSAYFFRMVYNGRDLTDHIHFCKSVGHTPENEGIHNSSTSEIPHRKQYATTLCPIEAIIRFLHDDYFSTFNATNFKDACTVHS
ncbi:hypothetical protein RUM44_005348 [Polyplax serrata]|uniref:2-phosphoxylose phosphatase 1 n=1 Tax=Polyplax serrata TaxID=468196 RepID=A0ABR1ADA5_POLSC